MAGTKSLTVKGIDEALMRQVKGAVGVSGLSMVEWVSNALTRHVKDASNAATGATKDEADKLLKEVS